MSKMRVKELLEELRGIDSDNVIDIDSITIHNGRVVMVSEKHGWYTTVGELTEIVESFLGEHSLGNQEIYYQNIEQLNVTELDIIIRIIGLHVDNIDCMVTTMTSYETIRKV